MKKEKQNFQELTQLLGITGEQLQQLILAGTLLILIAFRAQSKVDKGNSGAVAEAIRILKEPRRQRLRRWRKIYIEGHGTAKIIKEVKEVCDRCHKEVVGLITDYGNKRYFRRNAMWGQFMKPNEDVLCDECMWNDPGYKEKFPYR